MESNEYVPNGFDLYVRRVGKVSATLSALLAAVWLVDGCGGIVAALYSLAQVLVLIVLLWLPLLRWRIKGEILDNESARWALIASVSVFAVIVLSMVFDSTGKHGCFR
jgi:hypothetical protein